MRKKSDMVSEYCAYFEGVIYILLQLPLGIIMKDENKIDEMVKILDELHQYVPSTEEVRVHHVTTEDGTHTDYIRDIKYHCLLFAGDQLTVKRARSARSQHDNSQHAQGKLRGFVPVAQDWHAGQCLLEVNTCLKDNVNYFKLYL